MARRDYKKNVRSAFLPIARLAGREDLLNHLTTADLPEDRKIEQFRLFKDVELDSSSIIPLPGGGFVAVVSDINRELVLVSCATLSSVEYDELTNICENHLQLSAIGCDEAIFLLAAHEFQNFLNLSEKIRSPQSATDFLDIIDSDYSGHDFYSLQNAYTPITVLECNNDHVLHNSGIDSYTVEILSLFKKLRSPIIDQVVGDKICDLRSCKWVDKSNIIQALTSSQWRHVFLEIYRCIESLYYFPWVRDLKSNANMKIGVRRIMELCREDLKWFAREKESIGRLFEMVDTMELRQLEGHIPLLLEISGNTAGKRRSFGERVYSVRNTLVHHEDKEAPIKKNIPYEEIRDFSLYLAQFILDFNAQFGSEIPE